MTGVRISERKGEIEKKISWRGGKELEEMIDIGVDWEVEEEERFNKYSVKLYARVSFRASRLISVTAFNTTPDCHLITSSCDLRLTSRLYGSS